MKIEEKLFYYVKKNIEEVWYKDQIIEIYILDIASIYLSEPNENNERFINIEFDIEINNPIFKNFMGGVNNLIDLDIFYMIIKQIIKEFSNEIKKIEII